MTKIQIDDLAPEETGIVELVEDDDLDLIVGAMAPGSGFICSVSSGDTEFSKTSEECFRV
ncbi:hypothetical protein [Micromonospora sp. DT229]|uniref:hypothetical protein n=1 Tax=Micromonospora sp. DT229 TaxID=3393430 RepID=UPI003CE75D00